MNRGRISLLKSELFRLFISCSTKRIFRFCRVLYSNSASIELDRVSYRLSLVQLPLSANFVLTNIPQQTLRTPLP
jgi:hypothetical protein